MKNIFFNIKELEKVILRKMSLDDDKQNIIKRPTPTQIQIVGYILDNIDKEVYQKDLEHALNLRRATISDVLKRMEKNGLINRVIETNDSRVKKIVLSDDAKKIFEANDKRIKRLEEIATNDISVEELQIFSKIIQKMIYNLEKK